MTHKTISMKTTETLPAKNFAVALLFAILISVCVYTAGFRSAFADGAPAGTAAVPESTPTPTPEIPVEVYLSYNGVLNLYTQAVKEKWDPEKCMENNVNYLVAIAGEYGEIGYCYYDVNKDNIPELFIGCVGSKEIYAMYTLSKDNQPLQLIDAGERSSYYLEPDDCFVNFGSGSAYSGGYRILMMGNGELYLHCALLYDFSVNSEDPWFLASDDDWDISNDKKVSTSFAESAVQAYEENYVELAYIPIVA